MKLYHHSMQLCLRDEGLKSIHFHLDPGRLVCMLTHTFVIVTTVIYTRK